MAFNHVSLNPIPIGDPDVNLQRTAFFSGSFGSNGVTGVTLIPAVPGKRISVHSMSVSGFTGFIILQFNEVTPAGATVTTQLNITNANVNGIGVWPFSQFPWMTCGVGNALLACNQNGNTAGVCINTTYVQA